MINENQRLESQQKRQNMYHEIRRKQIQFSFKLLRKRNTQIPKLQVSKIVLDIFKQLKGNPDIGRKGQLLKLLKQIIQSKQIPQLINNYNNISLILTMQDDPKLGDIILQFVHQIIAQISSISISPLKIKDILNFQYLQGKKIQIINILLVIIGNLVIKDSNFDSLRYLIKQKNIFKKMMKLLQPSYLYAHIQQNLLWTSTILVYTINKYKLQNLDQPYFQNILLSLYNDTKYKIINYKQSKITNLNQIYHRLTIIIQIYQFKQDYQLYNKLQQQAQIQNIIYVRLLKTILFYYDYQLPKQIFLPILDNIKQHTCQQLIKVYFKIIINNMQNNRSLWKVVLNRFIKGVGQMENSVYKKSYTFTGLFMYFFQKQNLTLQVFQIIKRIWNFQGYLGCFQQCLQMIAQSNQEQIYHYLLQNNLIQ